MANTASPWRSAIATDARYARYLGSNGSYYPIERLAPGPREVLVS